MLCGTFMALVEYHEEYGLLEDYTLVTDDGLFEADFTTTELELSSPMVNTIRLAFEMLQDEYPDIIEFEQSGL